jgi:VanZ family protein
VAANVAGALIGGVGFIVTLESVRQLRRLFPSLTLTGATTHLLAYAVILVLIGAWEPFDFTIDVGNTWGKVKALANEARGHWPPITDELLESLRFALLTALASHWLERHNQKLRARLIATVSCASLAAALEASQFFITSRSPSSEDLVAEIFGVVSGAALYPALRRSARQPTLLIVASFCAAVPFYLEPFVFSSVYASVPSLLFLAYYERTSLQTVSHVIDLMLIYAPVGFALQWYRRSGAIVQSAVVTGVMASALEYAQGWIVGRYPDVTDVAVSVLGGVVGAAVARYDLEAQLRNHRRKGDG